MSIQNQNLNAILEWHQESFQREASPPQNKALLRVVNGRLEPSHKSDMSVWDRFLCFFGLGKYALEKVSRVVRETVEQAQAQQDLNPVIEHLNQKITNFSSHHIFRKIDSIALRTIGQPSSSTETPATTDAQTPAAPSTEANALAQALKASKKALEKQENAPRVVEVDDLRLLAEGQPSDIANGYAILAPYFSGAKIIGDGHCLFRSLATVLLRTNLEGLQQKIHNAALEKRLLGDSQQLREETSRIHGYNAVLRSIFSRIENLSVEDIMNDADLSDNFVQFLRFLGVAPWRIAAHAPEENKAAFLGLVNRPELKILNLEYDFMDERALNSKQAEWITRINWENLCEELDKPENMYFLTTTENGEKRKSSMWGGQLEQEGICDALDISIGILNLEQTGRDDQIRCTIVPPFTNRLPDVYLFYDGTHYNAAFPRDLQEMQNIFGPSTSSSSSHSAES